MSTTGTFIITKKKKKNRQLFEFIELGSQQMTLYDEQLDLVRFICLNLDAVCKHVSS